MKYKYIVGANWKCYSKSEREVKDFLRFLLRNTKNLRKTKLIIFPSFVYLSLFKERRGNFSFGAQNMFFETQGPFTGEISPLMIKDMKAEFVILGHSERRRLFHESDEMINKKVISAFKENLIPLICIGENLRERKERKTFQVIEKQLKKSLRRVSKGTLLKKEFILAYEPVWAIGKGKFCSPKEIETVSLFIRKILFKIYGKKVSEKAKILYGGSVNSSNIRDILTKGRVEGVLVGSASWDKRELLKMLKIIEKI